MRAPMPWKMPAQEGVGHHAGVVTDDLSRDPLDALCHLGSGTP
jgi:hypothetical protein